MLRSVICALLLAIVVLAAAPAMARIQDGSADVCWATDVEFPVPCDEDDE